MSYNFMYKYCKRCYAESWPILINLPTPYQAKDILSFVSFVLWHIASGMVSYICNKLSEHNRGIVWEIIVLIVQD